MKRSAKQKSMPVLFLVGPTAVGKSDIALALAKKIGGEIVSCDSMQVYKGMDIGTAKPPKAMRGRMAHHMMDIVPVSAPFDAAQYRKKALRVIAGILRRGKTSIVVGGTGLYMRALRDGLFEGAGADAKLRARLQQEAAEKGSVWLHAELAKADPVSAKKIHPNDTKKVIRALEVYRTTNKPISMFQKDTHPGAFPYPYQVIGLSMDRSELYRRVDMRAKTMFRKGLIKEVKSLLKKGLKKNPVACQAIGYKEILGWLDGQYDQQRALELIQRNSRRYAKRQFTWFKKDDKIQWIQVRPEDSPACIAKEILASLEDPQN